MATDVELQRAFGSTNPLASDGQLLKDITDEFYESIRVIADDPKLSVKQREKKTASLEKQFRQARTDMAAQIERLRYHRGIPEDPEALGYRAGRMARNLNVLRLMGGVVISSFPDMGNVLIKFGLVNTFRDGFAPMIRDFKTFRMSMDEGRYAGVNLDLALHSRMAAMYDIMDEVEYGSMAERAVQTATNKFGLISGIDAYNAGMKSFSAALTNGRMMRALRDMAEGKIRDRDVAYLAGNGIDAVMAGRMWGEITQTPGGGNQVSGAWLPNTESWSDPDLARAYRAALGRQVESTIVTPGTERPNWMDSGETARLIAQFRAFTFSSTQRVIMAAAQEARMGNVAPVINGAMISLGMGAVSYYLTSVGRTDRHEKMMDADINTWANEAVNRSGLLGVLAEVKNLGEAIPTTQPIASLGADTPGNSIFANPAQRMVGPTAGLIMDIQRPAMAGLSQLGPDSNFSEGDSNAVRRLLPYQNHAAFRYGFDAVSRLTNDLLGID